MHINEYSGCPAEPFCVPKRYFCRYVFVVILTTQAFDRIQATTGGIMGILFIVTTSDEQLPRTGNISDLLRRLAGRPCLNISNKPTGSSHLMDCQTS